MDGSELIPPPWAPAEPRLFLLPRALLLRLKGEESFAGSEVGIPRLGSTTLIQH